MFAKLLYRIGRNWTHDLNSTYQIPTKGHFNHISKYIVALFFIFFIMQANKFVAENQEAFITFLKVCWITTMRHSEKKRAELHWVEHLQGWIFTKE